MVEDMFYHGHGNGPNMIFAAYYPTGFHKIKRHQDREPLGTLKDVYAFVDGCAREMIFCKGWKNEERVLCIEIPQGFYCMYGQEFSLMTSKKRTQKSLIISVQATLKKK